MVEVTQDGPWSLQEPVLETVLQRASLGAFHHMLRQAAASRLELDNYIHGWYQRGILCLGPTL